MRSAVVTKVLAATRTQPRRVVATATWGRVSLAWDFSISDVRNHGAAVLALQAKIGETLPRDPGEMPDGSIVWIARG